MCRHLIERYQRRPAAARIVPGKCLKQFVRSANLDQGIDQRMVQCPFSSRMIAAVRPGRSCQDRPTGESIPQTAQCLGGRPGHRRAGVLEKAHKPIQRQRIPVEPSRMRRCLPDCGVSIGQASPH